jgi:hypothetical protein
VRALYLAIPPVSRTLPTGDRAVMASSGSSVMLALVADDKACARMLAPDFIQTMFGAGRPGDRRSTRHASLTHLPLMVDNRGRQVIVGHALSNRLRKVNSRIRRVHDLAVDDLVRFLALVTPFMECAIQNFPCHRGKRVK